MSTYKDNDAICIRALMLLQSQSNEATVALRDLLLETIQQKYGRKPSRPLPPFNTPTEQTPSPSSPPLSVANSSNSAKDVGGSESDSSNSDDIRMEILEDEYPCVVCRGMNYSSWNQLVECAECHSPYHKECHIPHITEDVSDPRVVWYCRNCNKSVNKPKSGTSSAPTKSNSNSKQNPSTRNSQSSPTNVITSKTFGGKRPINNKSSSAANSSKTHTPTINIISADRRLQLMKKKAAKKQDKRTVTK